MNNVVKSRVIIYLLAIISIVITALAIIFLVNHKTLHQRTSYCYDTFEKTNVCPLDECRFFPGRITDKIEELVFPQCTSKYPNAFIENIIVYRLMQITEPFTFEIKIPFWQVKILGKVYTPTELWDKRNSLIGKEIIVKGSV